MESVEEDEHNTQMNNDNRKKYIMSLLFIQTKELKILYNGQMEPSPRE